MSQEPDAWDHARRPDDPRRPAPTLRMPRRPDAIYYEYYQEEPSGQQVSWQAMIRRSNGSSSCLHVNGGRVNSKMGETEESLELFMECTPAGTTALQQGRPTDPSPSHNHRAPRPARPTRTRIRGGSAIKTTTKAAPAVSCLPPTRWPWSVTSPGGPGTPRTRESAPPETLHPADPVGGPRDAPWAP
jgi:hypothetical protein